MPDPNPHIPEHSNSDHNEFVLHIGSDYKNPEDLGGEIEFVLGGEPPKINKTSVVKTYAAARLWDWRND